MEKQTKKKPISEQVGRTFLTKEEIARRDDIINKATELEKQFSHLGQLVTSVFLKIDETKALSREVTSLDQELAKEVYDKYGSANVTQEGEVIPITQK